MAIVTTESNKTSRSFNSGSNTFLLSSEDIKKISKYQKQVEGSEKTVFLYHLSSILNDYLQHTRKIETQSIEISAYFQAFYSAKNIINSMFKIEKEPKDLEQDALLSIVNEFSRIKKVHSIYVQKYREELQILILLSIDQYDYALMDSLLDIEYNIRERYPEIVFEFFYPPVGISDKKDFIHPRAYCIFSR
jgi:hypothetical protein